MRRREFIVGLGAAALLGRSAGAEQRRGPVVGFLSGVRAETFAEQAAAFSRGLKETGYVEGRNLTIEYRWAEGHYDQLPGLAADLVQQKVAAIFATGAIASAQVAKAATSTIPIVFANGGDPIEDGLVASLNRPGGNVTGVTFFNNVLVAKRLGLVRELIPSVALVAVLVNPDNARAKSDTKDLNDAARALAQPIEIFHASNPGEIDAAFESATRRGANALLVNSDAFFNQRRDQLAALALRHRIPAINPSREFTLAGGLMSYGSSLGEAYREAGVYTGRILNGAKPAELPVLQPTKFELVINLKTAKALGRDVPPTLIARADEVIE